MARDLTVHLDDRPGTLGEMGDALGRAGINIDALCGVPCEGRGIVHILVEDPAAARQALEDVGIEVGSERDVILLEAEDRPGMLGEVAQKLGEAGVNIVFIYTAAQMQLVIGVDNLAKGRAAIA